MKILEKFINKFKGKKIILEEHNIVTLADKPIYLPNYQELTIEDKTKIDNYKKEININNFDTLISYTNELRDKSKDITNLLIKFLYELEQVSESLAIKKDLGKDIKINQYELVDYEIKYAKITSLNNILKEKRKELELKLLGVLKYKEEYQRHNVKHNIEYLGILGRDKKLKREMEEIGLRNLENTLKVAINALDYNLEVSRNSVETARILIDSLKAYIKKQKDYYSLRDKKYYDKLEFYKNINELIFENKLIGIYDLNKILCDNHLIYHDILPFKLANIEVQIDLAKEKYKDKFIKYFREQYNNILNIPNTLDNVDSLVKKINELLVIQEVYQEDISRELRNKLYEMKFLLLSKKFIENHRTKYEYINYEEKKYYSEIIKREYKKFIKLNSDIVNFIKYKIELLLGNNSLENVLLETYPSYLKTILLVNYSYYYREFFKDYIKNYNTKLFDIEYDDNLGDNQKLIINNQTKESILYKHNFLRRFIHKSSMFYENEYDIGDLYEDFAIDIIYSCRKYISADKLITIKNGTLTFAPGITKIIANHMNSSNIKSIKHIKFPNSLKEIGANVFEGFDNLQELNCPQELEIINHNAFSHCDNLKEINFNNKLREIRYSAFSSCRSLTKVILPVSLEVIEDYAFAYCRKLNSIVFEEPRTKKLKYGSFYPDDFSLDI